jgi:16S rRNA (adenine1518-N6/adenine1519-N6)-dimethyltransferase
VRARKRFGQNFLQDQQIIQRILAAINPQPEDHILEIGPGHGALTSSLIASGCRLDVVEIDRDLAAELRQQYPGLNVIEADILKFDFQSLDREGPVRVVGNLPYNISTPLLFRLFKHVELIKDMYFMLQLEVVERMVAPHSTSNYGRLSIMSQHYCEMYKLFDVAPTAFIPQPKITSAILQLIPHTQYAQIDDLILFQALVTRAFSQRRKTLRNALKPYLTEVEMHSLDIPASQRPETISGAQYIQCANYLSARDAADKPSATTLIEPALAASPDELV